MLRKLLALVGAILVLSVVAVAVIAARQRPPAIDGSDGGAEPLAWWSRKAIQGMFDYRVWSGGAPEGPRAADDGAVREAVECVAELSTKENRSDRA